MAYKSECECECDWCGKTIISGDSAACKKCVEDLEQEVFDLKQKVGNLEEEVAHLELRL